VSDEHTGLPHDLPEYVPNVPPQREESSEVRQVLIHGAVWNDFVSWLDRRGIALTAPVQFHPDDMPTYIMTPKNFGPEGP
jgi:hypothetical protein